MLEVGVLAEITVLILEDHEAFRRSFIELWDLRPTGDVDALIAAWEDLADRLEVHATAEEQVFYPVLLKRGSDEAIDETLDAVGDHNEIRDAIRVAAGVEAGGPAWWEAVLTCRKANDEHLAEEERDVIPDFREHIGRELGNALGEQWLEFKVRHAGARGVSQDDVDPQGYVEENS